MLLMLDDMRLIQELNPLAFTSTCSYVKGVADALVSIDKQNDDE